MKVVITGGTGFIGRRLAAALLKQGALTDGAGATRTIDEIVLFDQAEPAHMAELAPGAVTVVTGDIADRDTVFGLIDRDEVSVFHLASVVSGGGELDFDLAMRVNLDGGRHVLEACRARGGRPKVVFTSSIAVFGGDRLPASVGDDTKQVPQTTYGATKTIMEALINDYSRKGFLDGRTARLPTVVFRPGVPNAAASSFASAVVREPLKGADYALPVGPDTAMPALGYRSVVEGLIRLHDLPAVRLGADRAVSLPSLPVTVGEVMAALDRVAGDRALGTITIEPDPAVEAIVATWPQATDHRRALDLGLPVDESIDAVIREYIADYVDG